MTGCIIYRVDSRHLVDHVKNEDANETRAKFFSGPDRPDAPADAFVGTSQFDHFSDFST